MAYETQKQKLSRKIQGLIGSMESEEERSLKVFIAPLILEGFREKNIFEILDALKDLSLISYNTQTNKIFKF